MQKLVFTNGGGQTIDLTSGNFGITNWEGLSGVDLNIQVQQVPFQDGGVFLDALMEQREISVTVAIQDNNDLSTRYELKRQLISALNPKLEEGVLIYTNNHLSRQIKAVPQLPIFENKNSNDAGTLKASVVFSCPSPYWEDLEETEVELTKGVYTSLQNNGDVSCNPTIDLYVNGENPLIYNNANKKKIELEGNIDETIVIKTEAGEKSIYSQYLELFVKWANYKDIISDGNVILIVTAFGVLTLNKYYEVISFYVKEGLNSGLFNNGKFFLCGAAGFVAKSTDGINWVNVTTPTNNNLNKIKYENNKYYAVGDSGTVIESSDGDTWIVKTNTLTASVKDIVYGLGIYILITDGSTYKTSDLITFTQMTPTMQGVVFAFNGFIGFYNASRDGYIVKSTNGTNWTSNDYPLLFGNIFKAGENVIISTELGIMYYTSYSESVVKNSTVAANVKGGVYFQNKYLFIKNMNVIYSNDLNIYKIVVNTNYISGIKYLIYNSKLYCISKTSLFVQEENNWKTLYTKAASMSNIIDFIITKDRVILLLEKQGFVYSDDYENFIFSQLDIDNTEYLQSINDCDGDIYILTQANFYFKSTNGLVYDKVSGQRLDFIKYVNGYIFKCYYRAQNPRSMLIQDKQGQTVASVSIEGQLKDVAYGNGMYIAVSDKIYSSNNLTSWNVASNSAGDKVCFWNFNFYIAKTALFKIDGLLSQETLINIIDKPYHSFVISSDELLIFNNDYNLNNPIAFEIIKKEKDNLIDKLTANSDMSFSLEKGMNKILLERTTGEIKAIMKYRQKYIGV